MAIDATTISEAAIATTAVVGYMGFLGVRHNSETNLLIDERKTRVECEKAFREAQDRYHAALESVESERDRERQRADLLSVELQQYRQGSIGGMEKRP